MDHKVKVNVYVAGYNMESEISNTLITMLEPYQRSSNLSWQITVIDNGSYPAMKFRNIDSRVQVRYVEEATKSPLGAMNRVIAEGESKYICVVLDGARMWTPGVMLQFENSLNYNDTVPSTVTAYHLGPVHQSKSKQFGYDKAVEILMLERVNYKKDGYKLFGVSVLAGANPDGENGFMNESCCLFLKRSLWAKLGGFNEKFQSSGGGLVH
jgi:hypothetical protein